MADLPPQERIGRSRDEIDSIDRQIVELLDRRAALARAIGEAKHEEGKSTFFDPSRQKIVLLKALDGSTGEFPAESLRNVFVEIMSGCLSREKPPIVAFLGPEATYTHIAAMSEFGQSVAYKPFLTIPDIFHAVDRGWADYGVVPIENSTGGVIHSTLDTFLDFDLRICSEVYLRIRHNLISRNPLDRIKTIYSKTEPFQQCAIWLRENLPEAQLIEVATTAKGVELARDRNFAAAIGSELAARTYGLPIAARHIEDMPDNATRFIVIGREESRPTSRDKTSIMFSIEDMPGALYRLLVPFADRGINLTKIENRPTRRKAWDLVFFVDMIGHISDAPIAEAIDSLRQYCRSLRIMGSYPQDVQPREESPASSTD